MRSASSVSPVNRGPAALWSVRLNARCHPAAARGRSLLQIAFDDTVGAGSGVIGVLARGAAGAALAQQIPAGVQLDIDGTQPLVVGFVLVL